MNFNQIVAKAKAYKDIEDAINTLIESARQSLDWYPEDADHSQEINAQIAAYDEVKQSLQKAFKASL